MDGNGLVERYSECASYEGIHFEVWEGTPYVGEPLIDAYYYVPYSLEPSCPGMEEDEDSDFESPPDSTRTPPIPERD